ncbi:MAG: DUF7133 domain-containing protein, partial [Roseimicrobium sp.]
PDFPPQAEFRMGGTGLSGLALIESGPLVVRASARSESVEERAKARTTNDLTMAVANPITSKIQTIAMHRDGAYWKLAQLPDLITCDDPFFRPVALTNGPDGCIYVVDWYNKIISHNEVPRAHPDRDKTRGRIWRVKPSLGVPPSGGKATASNSATKSPDNASPAKAGTPNEIPDFTKLSTDELIALLGKEPVAKAHLAWQTLGDQLTPFHTESKKADAAKLSIKVENSAANPSSVIQSLWCLEAAQYVTTEMLKDMLRHPNSAVRAEIIRATGELWTTARMGASVHGWPVDAVRTALIGDSSAEVRQAAIQALSKMTLKRIPSIGLSANVGIPDDEKIVEALLTAAKPSLPNGPTIASSRGPKQIPVREAYDREFERFLVRMFLERHPDVVAKFLDSDDAAKLPVEARVLASLALEPKASASRVAKLLPQLDRAPNDEELLRLAQFPAEAGVGEALQALLTNEKSRAAVAEKLLAQRTKLDAAKIAPLLTETAKSMIGSADTPVRSLALQIIGGFQLTALEGHLIAMLKQPVRGASSVSIAGTGGARAVLVALRELRSGEAELFARIAESDPDQLVREEAVATLAASRAPDAATKLLSLYPSLQPAQRRSALNVLSSTKAGAKTIVAALLDKSLPQADLDGPTVERLATVLGDDPAITKLQQQLGGIFREVLLLDGQDTAWVDSKITLDGPFTVEAWVRLAPGISNEDGLVGVKGGVDMNFFGGKFRVFAGRELHDVCVATKPITPDLWTHLAV